MKHQFLTAAIVALTIVGCADSTTSPVVLQEKALLAENSNGFPQGPHDYRLNLIGVPSDKESSMDNNNGRRIFVRLTGTASKTPKGGGDDQNHIYLCNSTNGENTSTDPRCAAWTTSHDADFGVIDANATDGDGALLAVPDPCADADPLTACSPSYRIYARAHGPGGSATIGLCAEERFDELTAEVWCGSNAITLTAKGNARKAIEITSNLLSMVINVDGLTDPLLAACLGRTGVQTVYLFDNCFENYFWSYDNNGLKLLELRFYFVPAEA